MDTQLIIDNLPNLWKGFLTTLSIVPLSLLIGFVLAVPLSLAYQSKNPLLSWPVTGFVFFFRGTPLFVQIFLIYYGLPQFGVIAPDASFRWFFLDAYYMGVFAITLNTCAYQIEIIRGGIQSVHFGQIEAGKACGMSTFMIYRRIILPGAFRQAIPSFSNEAILILKGSALLYIITVQDLMFFATRIQSKYFAPIEAYLSAAIFYYLFAEAVNFITWIADKQLNKHLQPPPTPAKS